MEECMSVLTKMHGEVGLLTMNEPERRNPIDLEMTESIDAGLRELVAAGARSIVINGAGKMFSGGGDVNAFGEGLKTGMAAAMSPTLWGFNALLMKLAELPVPTIAAVEGAAAGGGMGLALAADLRVVGESTKFVAAQFRLGATPDGGLTYYLARALGPVRAFKLIMSSGTLTAQELLDCGLAESVEPNGTVAEKALALAQDYVNVPPTALRHLRRLMERPGANGLAEQLAAEARVIMELWDSDDLHEGVTAFLERRQPKFGPK
jgi:2-(1,2-epoxy-1,2-dihydrophenyl)acetyl-CoA isomerase